MVAILMMSGKLATLGLIKLKLTWNKGYDAIISVHHVTQISLYMWAYDQDCNSSIFVIDVIITSIL